MRNRNLITHFTNSKMAQNFSYYKQHKTKQMRPKITIFVILLSAAVLTGCALRRTASETPVVENRTTTPMPTQGESGVFLVPEQLPQFPGGVEAMMQFLSENLSHPVTPNLQGLVLVNFVVTETGQITNTRIMRSLSPEYDREVIRVIQAMPNWIPGTNDGEPVPVYMNIPVTFR